MNKVLLSAAVPLLVLLGWAISLELRVQRGIHVRVRVQGYDPRDLLTGHYIRFSLNLGPGACIDSNSTGPSCVCLAPGGDGFDIAASTVQCEGENPPCPVFLRGECQGGGRFTAGIERYSIPETLAPVLQVAPPNSSVELAIDSSGISQVVKYFVEDESVENWAQRKISEREHPMPVAPAP